MRKISLEQAALLLKTHDNIEILTHCYPDGDTVGSAYALCLALQSLGKKAKVLTAGEVSRHFLPFGSKIRDCAFDAEYVVSVDVAAPSLLGNLEEKYAGKINLCLDHHGANSVEADDVFADVSAAATGEIIYRLLAPLGVPLDKDIASALYLAVSTDTGCFRYGNTTADTMRICADLLEAGVDNGEINHAIFEQKSREKIKLERLVYETLTYFCEGKGALITVTNDMLSSLNLDSCETDGLASIPRQIEGVLIGITLREKNDGSFKVSVRTCADINACEFCSRFGGGGHPAASGCTLSGTLEEVKTALINAAEDFL